jgi:hypothetical protein
MEYKEKMASTQGAGIGDVGGDAVVLSGWDGEKGSKENGRRSVGECFFMSYFFAFLASPANPVN